MHGIFQPASRADIRAPDGRRVGCGQERKHWGYLLGTEAAQSHPPTTWFLAGKGGRWSRGEEEGPSQPMDVWKAHPYSL